MPLLYDAPPSLAYILGLLADLERAHTPLRARLTQYLGEAEHHGPQLARTQAALNRQNETLASQQVIATSAARQLATGNARCATLHQEIGNLNRRLDDLRNKMHGLGDTDAFRQLRRARATLGVQLEDRKKELEQLTQTVRLARSTLDATRAAIAQQGDALRQIRAELTVLQQIQPPAQLYLDLFANTAARAHAQLLIEAADLAPKNQLSRQPELAKSPLPANAQASIDAWQAGLHVAIAYVTQLHTALHAGHYAIEAATSWVGGRAVAVSEALYGLVAMGELSQAIDLFAHSSASDAFFHHIFQTFRGGCLGLFLVGRHTELAEALRLHQFATGIRGAYVDAFWALLRGDNDVFNNSLVQLAIGEWRLWQKSPTPGLGLVNLSVLGLTQLGGLRGFSMPKTYGPTTPWIVQPRQ